MDKQIQQILRECKRQGLLVQTRTDSRGHYVVTNPETNVVFHLPGTPSSHRARLNLLTRMRRELGFTWKGRGSNVPARGKRTQRGGERGDGDPEGSQDGSREGSPRAARADRR